MLETTQRFKNMNLPENVTRPQRENLEELLRVAQNSIHKHNPFVKDFKMILELPEEELAEGKIVISADKKPTDAHARVYNLPQNLHEVSILTNQQGKHDLVLHLRGGGLQKISDLNPKGMPLHFPLLFPHGTYGWDPKEMNTTGTKKITTRQWYSFHLQIRHNPNENFLHEAGRLFQEFLCVSWVTIENQRLLYQELNQKALRADSYRSVRQAVEERAQEIRPRADGLFNDDHQRTGIGQKILASSFTGGPRWYNAKAQDGMAICRAYHKPDLFITMTCNPKWLEIGNELKPGQQPQNRNDLVPRVFKLKKDQLLKDIIKGQLFGKVVAHMHTIEFQKRGLPHAHILIILADHDRQMTPEFVDSLITAELPPNPDDAQNESQRAQRKRLQDIVVGNMVHGPCGKQNENSPCMENGKCTKGFPKPFVKRTIDQII